MPRPKTPPRGSQRMPSGSTFYDRVVPIILLLLAVLLALMLLAAVAAFMGWVHL